MRIDHLVINIDEKYQKDTDTIKDIRESGFPYEPTWGKGTRGFKASNIWIGNEYFEMIHLIHPKGGGWVKEWVDLYNNGHRGLICLMIDCDDLDTQYKRLLKAGVSITEPKYLTFKWMFNLITRTMPWRNSYLPFFQGIPLQIGLQQMKDEKSTEWMRSYMVPNSRDNQIEGIQKIIIQGHLTETDHKILEALFPQLTLTEQEIIIPLSHNQHLIFQENDCYSVQVITYTSNHQLLDKSTKIENIQLNHEMIESNSDIDSNTVTNKVL